MENANSIQDRIPSISPDLPTDYPGVLSDGLYMEITNYTSNIYSSIQKSLDSRFGTNYASENAEDNSPYIKDISLFFEEFKTVMQTKHTKLSREHYLTDHRILINCWLQNSYDENLGFYPAEYISRLQDTYSSSYAFNRIICMTFIKSKFPEIYHHLNQYSTYDVMKMVYSDEQVAKTIDPDKLEKAFDAHKAACRRYLKRIQDIYFPDMTKKGRIQYRCFDYCFLTFLIDNKDTANGLLIISNKRQIEKDGRTINIIYERNMDDYYLELVIIGLISLAKNCYYTPETQDICEARCKTIIAQLAKRYSIETDSLKELIFDILDSLQVFYDKELKIPDLCFEPVHDLLKEAHESLRYQLMLEQLHGNITPEY